MRAPIAIVFLSLELNERFEYRLSVRREREFVFHKMLLTIL